MRDIFLNNLGERSFPPMDTSHLTQTDNNIIKNKLKIGLLNRKKEYGRILVNAMEICEEIKKEFNLEVNHTYFENYSFEEQIKWFNNHNVIISPQGAQIVSIPFTKEKSLIIECCAKTAHPYYYHSAQSYENKNIHFLLCDNHDDFPLNQHIGYENQWYSNITTEPKKIIKAIYKYLNNECSYENIYLL